MPKLTEVWQDPIARMSGQDASDCLSSSAVPILPIHRLPSCVAKRETKQTLLSSQIDLSDSPSSAPFCVFCASRSADKERKREIAQANLVISKIETSIRHIFRQIDHNRTIIGMGRQNVSHQINRDDSGRAAHASQIERKNGRLHLKVIDNLKKKKGGRKREQTTTKRRRRRGRKKEEGRRESEEEQHMPPKLIN